MISHAYNWYFVDEYELAKEQLAFYEKKLEATKRMSCNDDNKRIRENRIHMVISCIKYTYNL